jgi:hypothetical protein
MLIDNVDYQDLGGDSHQTRPRTCHAKHHPPSQRPRPDSRVRPHPDVAQEGVGLFSGERIGIAVDGNERIGPSGKGVEHGWDVSGPVWTATVVLVNRDWGFESPFGSASSQVTGLRGQVSPRFGARL